ncbi:MAG: hypothetical protein KAJ42_07675 [Gemmatimonadetes bacterium]|nr:hypothetical protein [Gemmatimonadota bacterium]
MSDPKDERRYSDQEFALILREASELKKVHSERRGSRDGLTLSEMQEIAREAGIDPDLVARAAALAPEHKLGLAARIFGGPAKYRMVGRVPGEVPEEEMGRIVETIREVLRHQGVANKVLDTLEWKTVGETSAVCVNVSARDGETRLEVSVDRSGSGVLTYLFPSLAGFLGTVILASTFQPGTVIDVATLLMVTFGPAAIVARTIFSAGTDKWDELVPRLMNALSSTADRVALAPAEEAEAAEDR